MSGFNFSRLSKYVRFGSSNIIVSTNPSPVNSGDTEYFSLAMYDEFGNDITYDCDYTSSNTNIALFETPNNGTIKFVGAGTVTIYVDYPTTDLSTYIDIVVV